MASARSGRLNRERLGRLPLALLALTPAALYTWWWRRAGWHWQAPAIGAAVYFVLWNGMYFGVHGYSYSFSMINDEASGQQLLSVTVTDAMLALAVAMLVVGVLRRKAGPSELARDAVNTLFLVATALAAQILIFYVAWDVVFGRYMPDLRWGFKYYLDVLQTAAFWPVTPLPLAALLLLFALFAAWVVNRAARLITRRLPLGSDLPVSQNK